MDALEVGDDLLITLTRTLGGQFSGLLCEALTLGLGLGDTLLFFGRVDVGDQVRDSVLIALERRLGHRVAGTLDGQIGLGREGAGLVGLTLGQCLLGLSEVVLECGLGTLEDEPVLGQRLVEDVVLGTALDSQLDLRFGATILGELEFFSADMLAEVGDDIGVEGQGLVEASLLVGEVRLTEQALGLELAGGVEQVDLRLFFNELDIDGLGLHLGALVLLRL